MTTVTVTGMLPQHAEQVLAIYQAGIDGGDATFETTAPTWEAFNASRLTEHRLVALNGDRVLGWPRSCRSPSGARTPGWSNTPSTSTPTPKAKASAWPC